MKRNFVSSTLKIQLFRHNYALFALNGKQEVNAFR